MGAKKKPRPARSGRELRDNVAGRAVAESAGSVFPHLQPEGAEPSLQKVAKLPFLPGHTVNLNQF
jgi:hypothetical protein